MIGSGNKWVPRELEEGGCLQAVLYAIHYENFYLTFMVLYHNNSQEEEMKEQNKEWKWFRFG